MRLNFFISEAAASLREKAENLLRKNKHNLQTPLSEADALKMIHELEVHKIELELQNEDLKLSRTEALDAAENYIELYEFSPIGYFTFSKEGTILELNLTGSEMLAKERTELRNTQFGAFVSDDTKSTYNLFLTRVFKSKKIETCELTLHISNDQPMYVHLSGMIRGNGKQCLIHVVDITGRKKAEMELEHKNEELLKLNAEKDKFFSILAHDLRGPCSSFLGITKILDEKMTKMKPEELQSMISSLRKSASVVYHLIENLLEWAILQRGLLDVNPLPVKLLDVINRTLEIQSDLIKQKNLNISVAVPVNMNVKADLAMLESICRNLISNAIKFSHKGSMIYISVIKIPGKLAEIAIKDKGIGMNADLVYKLFHMNGQTGRSGTEGEISKGLGLLICKELIERNGGQLRAESIEGHGSTFSFTLPLVK